MVVGRKKSSPKRPGQQPQQQAQNGISGVASSEADVVDGGVPGTVNGADGVNSGKDRKYEL